MRHVQNIKTSYKENIKPLSFYGTINDDNSPHITMINSLHRYNDNTLIWGEFSDGLSKRNQKKRPLIGFLSMNDDNSFVMGKANWLKAKTHGEEIDLLNRIPEFRYNNVYGYSPVHILKIKEIEEKPLLFGELFESPNKTIALDQRLEAGNEDDAISIVTKELLDTQKGIKMLSYIDSTGYPKIFPLSQVTISGDNRLIFTLKPYVQLLNELKEGMPIAIHALSYKEMGAVLINGFFETTSINGQRIGVLNIKKVYNPMLPVIGYVYPRALAKVSPVTKFKDVVYEYNV